MTQFAVVSRERHAGKRWQRPKSFSFVSSSALVPIAGPEIGPAAGAMPLAFFEEAGRFTLVALLSLVPNRNMLVAPDGRWLGRYIPAYVRSYPFRLLPQAGTEQVVLCVDTDSGLIAEGGAEGEDFVDESGSLAPVLKKLFDSLSQLERDRKATDMAVSALAQAGVLRPWPIKVKTEQGEQSLSGLYRIDETALNGLTNDDFLKLRRASALPIAYTQALSAGQLGIFQQLARLHAKLTSPRSTTVPETLDGLFGISNDDKINFDELIESSSKRKVD